MNIRHNLTAILPLVKSGIAVLSVLYKVLIRPYPARFFAAAFFNLAGQFLHLFAFLVSIQSIVVAFKFAQSDGEYLPFRHIFTAIGLSTDFVPFIMSAVVFIVFFSPAVVKKIEMKILAGIVARMHDQAAKAGVFLSEDLYITQTVPNYLISTCKLISGICFVIAALMVVAVFRIDLFFFIIVLSMFLAAISLLLSFRKINKKQGLGPAKTSYIYESRENFRVKNQQSSFQPLDKTVISTGKSRDDYFSQTLANWVGINRSSANGSIMVGLAMATIVWFVFTLHDFDQSQIFRLLYIVIAIRFAVNTAHNVGNLLAKLLESRMDLDKLLKLVKMHSV